MTVARTMFLLISLTLAMAGALVMINVVAAQPAAAAPVVGSNLIVNGDAEAGPGDNVFPANPAVDVPGWTQTGGFTAVDYTIGSGYPTPSDPGPITLLWSMRPGDPTKIKGKM